MSDIIERINANRLWAFPGGIHPAEMKSQSNQKKIGRIAYGEQRGERFYIPLKQHVGEAAELLVNVGDKVLKGQALTHSQHFSKLPVHAPTSGKIIDIGNYPANHPSGLSEPILVLEADGADQWRDRTFADDFMSFSTEQLLTRIYQAGIAGLGGAVFPSANKIRHVTSGIKLLIINGAECEPYITCDDRLMQDYTAEMLEGIRILRYLTRPEKVIFAIEDNKPAAIQAVKHALQGANDIDLRVIPTIYPSGASKQLIQVLTGLEVPKNARSSSLGILMHNVGTAFAIKRAVLDDEPLIERVVTLTGDKIPQPRNYWVRLGTPIAALLKQVNYQSDSRLPIFVGGPMMGYILPNPQAPVTKMTNCLIAPDHFEYAPPPPEQSCIRCSSCSDACPVQLLPQQLYWFARSEDHEKSEQYDLSSCIECGVCAYVCPSNIPLIQYFRQEKAKIAEIKHKERLAEEAKVRFEQREARLLKEKQQRELRAQQAAEKRRQEIAQQKGQDPVKAALERLKAKKAAQAEGETQNHPTPQPIISDNGEVVPDNRALIAQRKALRQAREQAQQTKSESAVANQHGSPKNDANSDRKSNEAQPKSAAVAAAIARAKAKKAATPSLSPTSNSEENKPSAVTESDDPRKAAVAAAIARAKAKKAASQSLSPTSNREENKPSALSESDDPRKAAVAAAIARAKAKKSASQSVNPTSNSEENKPSALSESDDPRKAAVAAAIARAKAKKAAQQNSAISNIEKL
ncbi:electron transport complex subunit RsxC [Pasteurellaceae bacterium USgator11]|nr:electron transport complex subunit RsxC [Pasteurellaceae bacterium USgator41]TNG97371.1 electron transport complex subunit RsxC [Pasteurellaceae bacterium UScroc31]TNH00891.1 electron transport complex subunit RsxC [Pasteurellaceae bacterium USgator11]